MFMRTKVETSMLWVEGERESQNKQYFKVYKFERNESGSCYDFGSRWEMFWLWKVIKGPKPGPIWGRNGPNSGLVWDRFGTGPLPSQGFAVTLPSHHHPKLSAVTVCRAKKRCFAQNASNSKTRIFNLSVCFSQNPFAKPLRAFYSAPDLKRRFSQKTDMAKFSHYLI